MIQPQTAEDALDWLSSGERNWRYLFEPGTGGGSFSSLLKELRVSLPSKISVQDLVRFGWLRPVLRIRVPDEFYGAWKSYPVFQFDNPQEVEGFDWVFRLYGVSSPQFRYGGWGQSRPPANWYEHPLDDRTHSGIAEILQHAIGVAPGQEPGPVAHPKGRRILPWIDLFAYWQAYHVAELVRALPLCQPILNVPEAPNQIRAMAEQYSLLKRHSDGWISSLERKWHERSKVFDWVSRYRTALGYWVGSALDPDAVAEAARNIAGSSGLDPDRIRAGIQDCLLVLWRDLEWKYAEQAISATLIELLRQDILRGVEFLVAVSGQPLDLDDPFWEPADRQPREWARLSEVLPFENQVARRSFPERAPIYLERLNQMLPASERLTKERIQSITKAWWLKSPPFQRFCLAFERLHQQFGEGARALVRLDLRASTPVDYLLLCSLFAEKLLLDRYLTSRPAGARAPEFKALIRDSADVIGRRLAITNLSSLIPWNMTKLHDLPVQRGNPFSTGRNLARTSLAEVLAAMLFDFAVMRNYAAHHDCVDDEIVYRAWGRDPLEALLGITLLTLS